MISEKERHSAEKMRDLCRKADDEGSQKDRLMSEVVEQ